MCFQCTRPGSKLRRLAAENIVYNVEIDKIAISELVVPDSMTEVYEAGQFYCEELEELEDEDQREFPRYLRPTGHIKLFFVDTKAVSTPKNFQVSHGDLLEIDPGSVNECEKCGDDEATMWCRTCNHQSRCATCDAEPLRMCNGCRFRNLGGR